MPYLKVKNDTQMRRLLEVVSRLEVMGYSPSDIVIALKERLGIEVCYTTVLHYLKRVHEGRIKELMPTTEEAKKRELAVILEVRRQAYEGLERSKRDFIRKVHEVATMQVGEFEQVKTKEAITTEHRNLDANYLRIILDTDKSIRDLLGLDAATRLTIDGTVEGEVTHTHKIDFDDLYTASPIVDPAEAKIKALDAPQGELIIENDSVPTPERNGDHEAG